VPATPTEESLGSSLSTSTTRGNTKKHKKPHRHTKRKKRRGKDHRHKKIIIKTKKTRGVPSKMHSQVDSKGGGGGGGGKGKKKLVRGIFTPRRAVRIV